MSEISNSRIIVSGKELMPKRVFSIRLGSVIVVGGINFKVTFVKRRGISLVPVDEDIELKEAIGVDLSYVKR